MRFPFPDGEIDTWACLGAITDQSARIWLRAPIGAPIPATLSVNGRMGAKVQLHPEMNEDCVAAADLVLDRPAPDAAFSVEVAGLSRTGRFAPAPGAPASFAFAFGSCHEPFESSPDGNVVTHAGVDLYTAMVRNLTAHDVRFLLLLGDQMYSDSAPRLRARHELKSGGWQPSDAELREMYRHLYRGYFNQREFRRLLEHWPSSMVWDDHEIFDGWGSLPSPDQIDRRLFGAAEQAYKEYQYLHHSGATLDDTAPYHAHFWFGDTGFFILDLRSERDYRLGRLLGDRQWQAFHAFLDDATDRECSTIFVAASVPVVHFSPLLVRFLEWLPDPMGNDVRDRWSSSGFRHERDALLDCLSSWQRARPRRQAIILSGDVHAGAAFRLTPFGSRGHLWQWTSSALTTPGRLRDRLVNRAGTALAQFGDKAVRVERLALVTANNFGLVEVSPLDGGGHEVVFALHAHRAQRGDAYPVARIVARPGP